MPKFILSASITFCQPCTPKWSMFYTNINDFQSKRQKTSILISINPEICGLGKQHKVWVSNLRLHITVANEYFWPCPLDRHRWRDFPGYPIREVATVCSYAKLIGHQPIYLLVESISCFNFSPLLWIEWVHMLQPWSIFPIPFCKMANGIFKHFIGLRRAGRSAAART